MKYRAVNDSGCYEEEHERQPMSPMEAGEEVKAKHVSRHDSEGNEEQLAKQCEWVKEVKESERVIMITELVTKLTVLKMNESPRRKHSTLKSSPRKRQCSDQRGRVRTASALSPRKMNQTKVEMHDSHPLAYPLQDHIQRGQLARTT